MQNIIQLNISLAFWKYFDSDCEGLHPPANGTTSTKLRTFGTNVTISCNAGFTPSVKETLYCQKDGHWNGSVGVCWKGNDRIMLLSNTLFLL